MEKNKVDGDKKKMKKELFIVAVSLLILIQHECVVKEHVERGRLEREEAKSRVSVQ